LTARASSLAAKPPRHSTARTCWCSKTPGPPARPARPRSNGTRPGRKAPAGLAGPQGPTGDTGAPGPQSPAGATGPAGPAGPAGAHGATVLSGTGAPAVLAGHDGDFYLDTTTADVLYGPKAGGTWSATGISLTGPKAAPERAPPWPRWRPVTPAAATAAPPSPTAPATPPTPATAAPEHSTCTLSRWPPLRPSP
jgi:hypothetical protein